MVELKASFQRVVKLLAILSHIVVVEIEAILWGSAVLELVAIFLLESGRNKAILLESGKTSGSAVVEMEAILWDSNVLKNYRWRSQGVLAVLEKRYLYLPVQCPVFSVRWISTPSQQCR